jgi:hypothetical protein
MPFRRDDVEPLHEPLAELEREMIDEYIRGAGHDPTDLRTRTDAQARVVLAQASSHAAGRLTEVESRLHYLRSLRGQE